MGKSLCGVLAACVFVAAASPARASEPTLELVTGHAVLERPLELSLRLHPWAAEQAEYPAHCVQAELRYGEFTVPPDQVHVSTAPAGIARFIRLVISSALLVNEPLVHVRVMLHCRPQADQEWTVFADLDAGLPTASVPAGSDPWHESVAGLVSTDATEPPADQGAAAMASHSGPVSVAAVSAAPAAPRVPTRSVKAAHIHTPPAPSPAPHLQIDSTDAQALARSTSHPHAPDTAQSLQPALELAAELAVQVRELRQDNERWRAMTATLQTQVDQLGRAVAAAPLPALADTGAVPFSAPLPILSHPRKATGGWASAVWVAHDLWPWATAIALAGLASWALLRLATYRTDGLDRSDIGAPPPRRVGIARGTAHPHRPARAQAWRMATPTAEPIASIPSTAVAVAVSSLPTAAAETGRATLAPGLPTALHARIHQFIDEGHRAAAAMLLEAHLQAHPVRSAPSLLLLRDVYAAMDQPEHAARVETELSTWFNLRPPGAAADDGNGVAAHLAAQQRLEAALAPAELRALLEDMLQRPGCVEALQLSAFRELLARHGSIDPAAFALPPAAAVSGAPTIDLAIDPVE